MSDRLKQYRLDPRRIARQFGAASAGYDAEATLQNEVRAELLQRAAQLFRANKVQSLRILDLGTGTGAALPALAAGWPQATLVALDVAAPMLHVAQQRQAQGGGWQQSWRTAWRRWFAGPLAAAVCADATALPLATRSFNFVFSNLMLQWCSDLDAALAEVRRVLTDDGTLLFSTFGPGTLAELRAAWATVDNNVHVSQFVDMHDLGAALARAGFSEPVLDVDRLQTRCANVRELMQHLKSLGARNAAAGASKGLTGRGRLRAFEAAYEGHRDNNGLLPVSWDVIYGCAFAADSRRAPSDLTNLRAETEIEASAFAEQLRRRRRGAPPQRSPQS